MEITLSKPIIVGKTTVEKVEIKPLTMGDNEDAMALAVQMGKADNQFTLALCLLAKATGLSYDKLRTLPMTDGQRLINAMNNAVSGSENPTEAEQAEIKG